MRCEHVQDRILEALLDGETEIPAGLRPHVEGCARCAAEIELLRKGVLAAGVASALSAAPPPGMKERVFAAIASEAAAPKAAPAAPMQTPERRPVAESRSRGAGPARWAVLRVASAAVGVFLLCGVGLQLSAMRRETGRLLEVVDKIDSAQGVDLLRQLLDDEEVRANDRWVRVLEDASMQLQDAQAARENPKDLYRIAETVRTKHLVESLRSLEDEARDSASRRRSLSQIRDCLQDIEDIQQ